MDIEQGQGSIAPPNSPVQNDQIAPVKTRMYFQMGYTFIIVCIACLLIFLKEDDKLENVGVGLIFTVTGVMMGKIRQK